MRHTYDSYGIAEEDNKAVVESDDDEYFSDGDKVRGFSKPILLNRGARSGVLPTASPSAPPVQTQGT